MNSYLYDGTFNGFLSVISEIFQRKVLPDQIVYRKHFMPTLFGEVIEIETDEEKAALVVQTIISKMGIKSLRHTIYCYLSAVHNCEMMMFDYIRYGLEKKKSVNQDLTMPVVKNVLDVSRKVAMEAHRLKGLLRFTPLGNELYYGPIEPDFNVVTLLAPHFMKRMNDQRWIIHDKRRHLALMWDMDELFQIDAKEDLRKMSKRYESIKRTGSDPYQKMWQNYFKAVAIDKRRNPRQQRQYMPQRYWKYLTEQFL